MCGLVAESVGPTLDIGLGSPMWWPAAVYVFKGLIVGPRWRSGSGFDVHSRRP
jgi:hypothetical protein